MRLTGRQREAVIGGFYLVKNTPFGLRRDRLSCNILGIIGERARGF